MRIAVNTQLISDRSTGIGVVSLALLQGLSRLDVDEEFHVFVPESAELTDVQASGRWHVHPSRVTGRSRTGRILWETIMLPMRLKRLNADLLHATAYVAPPNAPCPIVLTLHDVIALKSPQYCSFANTRHFRARIPSSVRAAAHIVASSENTKRDIIETLHVPPGKITVIHPPVPERFRRSVAPGDLARVRRTHKLPERFLLFVGNIEPKKNIPTMLRVLDTLTERGRREKLVVVGKRGWRSKEVMRALKARRRAGYVVLTDYVPSEDLPAIYSLATVFYFPSLYEGFGLPPLEAMACDTPVVCSNVASLPEVVGDAARTVEPMDVDAHVAALEELLDDEVQRRQLVEAGRERIRGFTVQRFAERHLELYRKVYEDSKRHD